MKSIIADVENENIFAKDGFYFSVQLCVTAITQSCTEIHRGIQNNVSFSIHIHSLCATIWIGIYSGEHQNRTPLDVQKSFDPLRIYNG